MITSSPAPDSLATPAWTSSAGLAFWIEEGGRLGGRFSVAGAEGGGVGVQRRRGLGVAESAGHRSNVVVGAETGDVATVVRTPRELTT